MTDSDGTPSAPTPDADGETVDIAAMLDRIGFDPETNVLTRRQAEVLALREHGLRQRDIADRLGTSRANVSNIESSARENVKKATETVGFAEALSAPVRVEIPPETDLYDVPNLIFDAADEAGIKVTYTAPDLMKRVSDGASTAVEGRNVKTRLFVSLTTEGTVRVRQATQ